MKIRLLLLALLPILLGGCPSDNQTYSSLDTRNLGAAVGDGKAEVRKAIAIAASIDKTGSKPGDPQVQLLKLALTAADNRLALAQDDVAKIKASSEAQVKEMNAQVNQLNDELAKAREEIARDKAQHQRENLILTILWFLGPAVFWGASTFGKIPAVAAFPPAAIIPAALYGLAALVVTWAIGLVVLKFWAAISWLIHLL